MSFFKEYMKWRKEHKQEVQEAILRKEAMKTPLNYQLLDQLFCTFFNQQKDAVMEIEGKDFKIKLYYDEGNTFRRETTTERILRG